MTVLATVRNTGSHTCHNILAPLGEMHYLTEDQRGPCFWFGHTEATNIPRITKKVEVDGPLILSMRNPRDVCESWIRRSKPLDKTFKQMWSALFNLKSSIVDSYWLPVDTEDRDEYLDEIEYRLDTQLNRDWTPKGVFTAQNYEWSGGMTMDEAVDWLRQFPFEQFGYDLDSCEPEGD